MDAPGSQSLFHRWLSMHVPGQASRPRNGVGTLGPSREGPNFVHSLLHHLGPGAQLRKPPWQGCGQDVAVPKGQEPQVGLAALLSLLSADSRALPSARPAKPEFSDFPSPAAAEHQRRCLFGFLKRRANEQRRKAGRPRVGEGTETDKRKRNSVWRTVLEVGGNFGSQHFIGSKSFEVKTLN